MKKILMFALSLMVIQAFSTPDSSIIYIKKGALPPEILKKFEESALHVTKVENILQEVQQFEGKIDPIEVGLAIDTVSTILSRQSNKFAESRIGEFTIVLVLWRVFGVGFSKLILKIIFFVAAFFMFCVTWRRIFMTRKFVKKAEIIPGRWFNFKKRKILEWHTFQNPTELLVINEDNKWKSSGSDGFPIPPEYVIKFLTLCALLIAFFVVMLV